MEQLFTLYLLRNSNGSRPKLQDSRHVKTEVRVVLDADFYTFMKSEVDDLASEPQCRT